MWSRLLSAGEATILLCLVVVSTVIAVDPKGSSAEEKPPADPAGQLKAAIRLANESLRQRAHGELAAAIRAASQSVEIEERLFGAAGLWLPGVSDPLIHYEMENGDIDAARKFGRRLLEAKRSKFAAHDWQLRHLERLLAEVDLVASWDRPRRDTLRETGQLAATVLTLSAEGKPAEALKVAERLAALRASLFGETHFNYALSLFSQGQLRGRTGDRDGAERCFRSAVERFEATIGRDHPYTAMGLDQLGQLAVAKSDLKRADEYFTTCADVRRKVSGERDPLYGWTLAQLGDVLRRRREFPRAVAVLKRAVDNLTVANGKRHATRRFALMALAQATLEQGDMESARKLLEESAKIESAVDGRSGLGAILARGMLVVVERNSGRFGEAAQLLESLLADLEHSVGVHDPQYTRNLAFLGQTQSAMGEGELARKSLRRAVLLRRETLPKYPDLYASALVDLSEVVEVGEALPLLREARELLEKEHLGRTVAYAACLRRLGQRSIEIGDRERGLAQAGDAIRLLKEILGPENDVYLSELATLAALCRPAKHPADSVQLWRAVLDGQRKVKPETHLAVIGAQASLADALIGAGKFDEAEPLVRAVVTAYETRGQTRGLAYGSALRTLGFLFDKKRDRRKAVETWGRAADVFASAHMPRFETDVLTMAAMTSWAMLDLEGAERLARRAEGVAKNWATVQDPAYADVLAVEAKILATERRFPEAMSLFLQAAEIRRHLLDKAFPAVSEREQFLMTAGLREDLDSYLSLSSSDAATPSQADQAQRAYESVLAWKGASYVRQRRLHLLRSRPELASLSQELLSISSQLASYQLRPLLGATAEDQTAERRLRERRLRERRERLEADLSHRAASFSDPVFDEPVSLKQLSEAIPQDAVLLDFLEYNPWLFPQDRQIAVFVIRPGQPVARVDLGPIDLIRKAIADWRPDLPRAVSESQRRAAIRLRKLIWRPVARFVGPKTTVFVSPDGVVAGLPIAALPGDKLPYLLEERAVAVLPVPRLLPHLLRSPRNTIAATANGKSKLLVVGDVDYDAERPTETSPPDAGSAEVPQTGGTSSDPPLRSLPMGVRTKLHFDRLAGTKDEIAAVLRQWKETHPGQSAVSLAAGNATKRNVCQAAEQSRILHLATHGFFLPKAAEVVPSAGVDGSKPVPFSALAPRLSNETSLDAACGIALAGANRVFKGSNGSHDEGVLTGLEAAQLGLEQTDLVVLSACETGLGEAVGGEGLLSLQRAFQVAGARSVIASLWKIPDRGTRLLMERFYSNLWKSGNRSAGPLTALREAQLWMLNEGGRHPDLVRGLTITDADADTKPGGSRLPPYFWAAFALSGDWR